MQDERGTGEGVHPCPNLRVIPLTTDEVGRQSYSHRWFGIHPSPFSKTVGLFSYIKIKLFSMDVPCETTMVLASSRKWPCLRVLLHIVSMFAHERIRHGLANAVHVFLF